MPEGEKDVDFLWKHGFLVCNPFGAGKWEDRHIEVLKEVNVTIVPDSDNARWAHARQIAQCCYGKPKRIGMLRLPDSKDVSDCLKGDVRAKG